MFKYIFYFLLGLIFLSCDAKHQEAFSSYNVKKDKYVNSILDKDPIFVEKDTVYGVYKFRYEEFEIQVYYNEYIPYKQKESWVIFCIDKEGNQIMLESYIGLSKHQVSNATLNRIKKMCE